MREMRQKTPGARGETQTSSDINFAPVGFSLNQNSAVCLPLVSDSQRLIWVHSNQINLQIDGAAELDKAFDRFPYLTQKETAALAQRCSLHPDQVKVWFMVQRLRYGISWDYKDIHKVQMKFKSSRGKVELHNRMGEEVKEDTGENNTWKREVKESGGKKAGKVREELSTNERRMMGENVRANERLERKFKQERLMKKIKDREVEEEENKRNTHKKRKRVTVIDKMGKKRMKQGDEAVVERAGEVEIRSDKVERESTKSKSTQLETTLFTRKEMKAKANKRLQSVQGWPADKSFVVPDEPLDASPLLIPLSQTKAFDGPPLTDNKPPNNGMTPVKSSFEGKTEMKARLEGELHAESTNYNGAVADFGKLKELMEVNNNPVDGCTPIRCNTKTHTQLAMMKVAFSHCQYPDREEYNRLVMLIGVPRYTLIQWFGDMRYYIKKGRPRWMNQEQYSQALATIKYRQCLNALAKAQPSEGGRKATWKMKLETSESCSADESVQVPPE
ncbi:homeobox and leucine zipper encoding b isoform X2 [Siniperca chuatsi]|nr:homeobox and leucine zipper encoding b isoform X2 [Siniperca chuatsi]XP_044039503.1 homeobox and leucine zipper encoding b isoform X2 [Siniperca chuatsi]XP_044039504.1 homeobox and leucine zipper encoding b isoform X2 [Siniperca chuatsi]